MSRVESFLFSGRGVLTALLLCLVAMFFLRKRSIDKCVAAGVERPTCTALVDTSILLGALVGTAAAR